MTEISKDGNALFPVFLKLESLRLLIVGGGYVGMEKLQAVLNNAPATHITLVAETISEEITRLAKKHTNLTLCLKRYEPTDLDSKDLVIVAVNNTSVSEEIRRDAKTRSLLVNVADKPALCDFYLSSVVQKGDLKIAISTNGKSPTIAKRLKEVLQEIIPMELNDVLQNMQLIRDKINGDFADKVTKLNTLTKGLVNKEKDELE